MDAHRTGRVPLSKFYGTGMETDWRFGESEDYLRQLGALDETSWRGKQVIVSNYMQGASNCAVATPERLLEIITGMVAQSSLDDDFPPSLTGSMQLQLEQIAAAHSGKVPLHGRLFAQWFHYVFPRECAFPHKAGVVSTTTPHEHGQFYASDVEMHLHALNANHSSLVSKEGQEWMSQWSPEEELIAEHAAGFEALWECGLGAAKLMSIASFVSMATMILRSGLEKKESPAEVKQHWV